MKMYFDLNSQRNKKIELFSQNTYAFKILGNDAIVVADCQDIRIFSFHLNVGFQFTWLKEDNGLHTSLNIH